MAEITENTVKTPKRSYHIERIQSEGEIMDKPQKNLAEVSSLLMSWPNMDIWPFKFCVPLTGFLAGFTGSVINTAFRKGLVLGHTGKVTSYFVTAVLPGFVAGSFHYLSISQNILSQEVAKCPVCLQVKSGALQVICGCLYPIILTPIMTFSIASKLKSIYLPKIHKDPKSVLAFATELFTPALRRKLSYLAAIQLVAGMGIAYFEQDCFYRILLPILKSDKPIISKETHKIELYPNRGY